MIDFVGWLLNRFTHFDRDGDGLISRADLYRLLSDRNVQGEAAAAVAAMLRHLPRRWFFQSGHGRDSLRQEATAWQGELTDTIAQLTAPDLNRSLYRAAAPAERWRDLHQGHIEDCWFVSAAIALGRFRPNELMRLVHEGKAGTYDVTFPGHEPVRGIHVTDAEIAFYRPRERNPDGLLLPVLEKAHGIYLKRRTFAPFEELNAGAIMAGKGIRLLTGHGSRMFYLSRGPFGWWEGVIHRQLTAAVTADPPRLAIVSDTNFRRGHLRAVIGYDPANRMITLQDPYLDDVWGPLTLERFVKEFTFLFVEQGH
jgi:hypothetical protein